jgi:hypothetical protein
MSNIDLYPNPAFVEAVRKDGYNKYGFDVFLMARNVDDTETDMVFTMSDDEYEDIRNAYTFIESSIQMTDKKIETLRFEKTDDVYLYEKYKNTIDYLLKYYDFLIKEGIIKINDSYIGASYGGGIVKDYIKAVNSEEAILYTKEQKMRTFKKKWPDEMSSWFPENQLIHDYQQFPPMIQFGGPKQRWNSWYFNIILVSFYRDEGFDYVSKNMFMNWKGNPLNR